MTLEERMNDIEAKQVATTQAVVNLMDRLAVLEAPSTLAVAYGKVRDAVIATLYGAVAYLPMVKTYAPWLIMAAVLFSGKGCALPDIPWVNPTPTPAPIPAQGLRVLIIHETNDRMPAEQQSILTATEVLVYAAAHCAKGPDGKTPEFRVYDKDVDLSKAPQVWKDAMARPRASLPWVIISDGTTGFEGPLPANVPAMMELLRKYGG